MPDWLLGKRHAIAVCILFFSFQVLPLYLSCIFQRQIILQSNADTQNLVYYLSLSECNPEAVFDDDNLPRGICDRNVTVFSQCTDNIIIGWGKGGDNVRTIESFLLLSRTDSESEID